MPGVQTFESPDAPPITVRWQSATAAFAQAHAEAVRHLADLDPAAITGPTRDGVGTFVYATETQPLALRVAHTSSSLQHGDGVAWCSASAPMDDTLPRSFFEACQSLMKAD